MLKSPSNIFDKLIYCSFVVLIFFSPLIFTTSTFELFEFPKTFFLYFLGATIILLYSIKKVQEWKVPKINIKNPINILVLGFLIINIISTLLSSHLYTSVWGYYTRFNGGLMSVLVIFGVFFVAVNILKKDDYENLFLCLTLLPISLHGITQYFQEVPRVYSTFGQPNWLAAYLVMVLPISLYY